MNIGIVCWPTYGGSGVIATELAKLLVKRGHIVHMISYALPMRLQKGFEENLYYHEVEMSRYPVFEFPLYTLSLASKLIEVTKYQKLDLIHCHYAIPHAASGYLAKQILSPQKIKIVTTLHGTDITLVGYEPDFQPILKFSIEQSDGVTAVSEFLKEQTINNYQIKKDIKVIHNFVDIDVYNQHGENETRSHYVAPGQKLIIHISNFRAVKRVPDVVRCFKKIRDVIPSRLVLIGDGPDRSIVEHMVREYGLQNDVIFLGKQIEFINILSAADVFLMPSQTESFGLSALEAMACHVPVIASDAGGLPELIEDGKSGYIVEMGDIDMMANRSLQLLKDNNLHSQFKTAARQRALEFDARSIILHYESYYEEVLGK